MRKVIADINCGETTCSYEYGKFCKYVGTNHFGAVYVCTFFPSDKESFTNLAGQETKLLRCDACLKADLKYRVCKNCTYFGGSECVLLADKKKETYHPEFSCLHWKERAGEN